MVEREQDPHACFECDADFVVHTAYEMEESVSFCPFCGSEVDNNDNLEDELIFDDEEEDKF